MAVYQASNGNEAAALRNLNFNCVAININDFRDPPVKSCHKTRKHMLGYCLWLPWMAYFPPCLPLHVPCYSGITSCSYYHPGITSCSYFSHSAMFPNSPEVFPPPIWLVPTHRHRDSAMGVFLSFQSQQPPSFIIYIQISFYNCGPL